MNQPQQTLEPIINKSQPRPATENELEDICNAMTTMWHYDLEDDEHEPFERSVRGKLQEAAIAVFASAQPYPKKIAVIIWGTQKGRFDVFEWDETDICNPIEYDPEWATEMPAKQ